ncbi:hypothetical protein BUALT_Bualt08G0036600 [Buddleja alternifolia]|uniref:Pectinesterase inhibitor domain-containing protein n=1 Tax=Buddleja alternifolia TaxID=168488 RepID=A0AAV6X4U8_9LAMI|nr:hypothetical protein BUALT_Bualt08G0036600 [Buddleja alternifolia]
MVKLGFVPLLITFISLPCFLPSKSFSAAQGDDLIIHVCKNTNDFIFCNDTIYSDTRAIYARTSRTILAYIAFGKAAEYTIDIKDVYLPSEIKSIAAGGGESGILQGLLNCLDNYKIVRERLAHMLKELDAVINTDFDKLSLEIEGQACACENNFNGRSPMTKMNDHMVKLANICYEVALLYKLHN